MKKFFILIIMLIMSVNIFATVEATDTSMDWFIDLDAGTYIKKQGTMPYINTEAMIERGAWRVGAQAELLLENFGIVESGLFAKNAVFWRFSNLYTEASIGVGIVSNKDSDVVIKYRPEGELRIDMGNFYVTLIVGVLLEDEWSLEDSYFSIGVQKRFE